MKRLLIIICLAITTGCSGGGGGGSDPVAPSHPPTISNLQYSPKTATIGQSGGAIQVTGSVDFVDAGGDLASFTLKYGDSCGSSSNLSATNDLSGVSGAVSGTATTFVIVNTSIRVDCTFEVWVTDSQGNSSNKLTGTFIVNS